MRRFSSGSTRVTFSRCSDHVLPTSVQTGAKLSARPRSPSSWSAPTSRLRVIPKAATVAFWKRSPARSSNRAASFGFEPGNPPSIMCTPSESSAWATRTFSSADSDMPSPCMPSRSVVS